MQRLESGWSQEKSAGRSGWIQGEECKGSDTIAFCHIRRVADSPLALGDQHDNAYEFWFVPHCVRRCNSFVCSESILIAAEFTVVYHHTARLICTNHGSGHASVH